MMPELSRRSLMKALAAVGLAGAVETSAPVLHALEGGGTADGPLQWVNVMLGTGGHGHTYPGATVPFGMVQVSPDTARTEDEWDWCSGYHYSKDTILGFSHTHLSGTGVGDCLDFLLMPGNGELSLAPTAWEDREKPYSSRFSHTNESAHPGYYSVLLDRFGIHAELTATERAALHRYTFSAADPAYVVVDLTHCYGKSPETIEWCSLAVRGSDTLLVGHATRAWAPGRQMFAALTFSQPWERIEVLLNDAPVASPVEQELRGKSVKAIVHFTPGAARQILVKAGLSAVSAEGARNNMAAEIPGWDFDGLRRAAEDAWRRELNKIRIKTADANARTIFYTALYHTMLAPTLFDDVDGRYRGMDGEIHQLPRGERNYTTFSLWDTYRAEHPLMTLIHADRVPDMVNSLVRMAVESPEGMPVWPLQGKETGCMTGYHSAAVIAEACAKGFTGIDYARGYVAMQQRAFVDDYRGLGWYRSRGYIPADLEPESVSKALEYCYDDWSIAHVAKTLGDADRAAQLFERSRNYRNLWDAKTGFLCARLDNGSFAEPFNPIAMGHSKRWRDYTESNAWQTLFAIQHDVRAYICNFGGNAAFVRRLDELFDQPSTLPDDAPPDISGMIGQYAHGNEPSHHIAYLYAYAGEPARTQRRIHTICTTLYKASVDDAVAGNEDCGQMSAWFVLSALGFYSVDPVSTQYVFGTPLFDHAEVSLGAGRTLTLEARRPGPESIYIRSVSFNGRPHTRSWFSHREVGAGGGFVFEMSSEPSEHFGKLQKDLPGNGDPACKIASGQDGA